MAVTSAQNIINMKDMHFEREEDGRIDKYTLADDLPEKISELRLIPRAMATLKPSYTVRKLTTDDRELILEFLRRFFFRDEPLNQTVELLETPESTCVELEEYATSTLAEEVSFAAVDEHGEFVGIIMNGIVTREDAANAHDKSEDCPNPKFKRILRLLMHLDKEAKIWEKVNEDCNKVMEVRIASTHSGWRGRGLMRVLCEESEREAREKGCKAMRMDASSAFSALAAERLNYKRVYTLEYSSFEGAPVPEPPHTEARVYIKEI